MGWRLGDERVTVRRLLQHAPAERVQEAEALTRRALRDLRAAASAEPDRPRGRLRDGERAVGRAPRRPNGRGRGGQARLPGLASDLWSEHRAARTGRGRGGQTKLPGI